MMSSPIPTPLHRVVLTVLLLTLSACATAPGRTRSDDPWQGFNRGVYKVNDLADRAIIKPAAKGYATVTPSWLRKGVSNFFTNLGTPWVMVNELLQGKPGAMAQDTCRLVLNTVVGLGGFIDVAGKLEMDSHDEDFGQTLAVWGVPSGPYLVLPAYGPSTLRDGFGRIPDFFGRPLRYADISWETSTGITALDVVQTREGLLALTDSLNQAYDPYGVMRDAWLQRREYLIYDGNPPVAAPEEDYMLEDADDAEARVPADNTAVASEPSEADATEPATAP